MTLWKLKLLLAIVLGLAAGVGIYTFVYARGYSYLTDDPRACANCHVMREQYEGWMKGSHRNAATCNDCHTPASFVPKYMVKGENGFWHSFAFTSGLFPDNIEIRPHNYAVAEEACRKCHTEITESIGSAGTKGWVPYALVHGGLPDSALSCIRCHASVGHPSGF